MRAGSLFAAITETSTVSPVMAPAMTPTEAIFSPVKICGSPVGSFIFHKVCQRLAPWMRAASSRLWRESMSVV